MERNMVPTVRSSLPKVRNLRATSSALSLKSTPRTTPQNLASIAPRAPRAPSSPLRLGAAEAGELGAAGADAAGMAGAGGGVEGDGRSNIGTEGGPATTACGSFATGLFNGLSILSIWLIGMGSQFTSKGCCVGAPGRSKQRPYKRIPPLLTQGEGVRE